MILEQKKKWMERRWFQVVLSMMLVVVVLGSAGFIYQYQSLKADAIQYPPVGEMVELDGQQMHMYKQGEGDITIVLASGHGTENPYVDFYPLHENLSKQARVVIYDRFGYGWSDQTSVPRDIDTITQELSNSLRESGEKGPYLFVAHSIASLEAIRFAQTHPDEVVGIVLLDAGNPTFYETYNTPSKTMQKFMQTLKTSGALRVLSHVQSVAETLLVPEEGYGQDIPEPLKEMQLAMLLKNFSNDTVIDEMMHLQSNAKKVVDGGHLGDLPLIWFTAGSNQQVIEGWAESQEELAEWSTNHKQIILDNAGHYVHHHEPELIIEEISSLAELLSQN
ncbi:MULTISPECIES: alpha/beta fold hydrolase [Shouchella]|uniref:alpha/beta fold hydrolase n=1 Tax=Shouchella TaxID=2893057 RepID=UPI00091F715E|nr:MULTISPECIES: alpha/beta hydrolase [Shouchella]MBX0320351.1 alpha/beta hydrolase [Shouchella clausii]MDO7282649.1 alpha/beta hydrolase [Shouchella clausii]MDO7302746.1 alpha/beta hydrolase [Shouchella clausii]SHK94347.1 Pimeloyl-ACP methyl ester carboxylesterase [Shouchella rhizosphaerae]